jgi:oligoendopeptidase F
LLLAEVRNYAYGLYDLLSSTGMADANTLAARFDMDITTEGFWRSSLDVICKQIAEFERLVG